MKGNRAVLFLRAGVVILGLAFLTAGLARREHLEVLQKAVMVCLECIGIG